MTETAVRVTPPPWAASSGTSSARQGRLPVGQRWLILAILGGLLVMGAGLRLDRLDVRGMGHVESYTPGLHFPPDISSPRPRLTLWQSIRGPMFEEPHPPAWYAVMWPWTRAFGTDIVTIRLPSLLFGVASIALVFQLGTLVRGWPTGLLAAGFLTFNGHHLLFSQVARPTQLAVVLSILSTTLLVLVTGGGRRRRLVLGGYLAVTLLGLATLYYFWPILAAQMVWVGLRSASGSTPMRSLLRLQWLLVIVGAPLVTLAVFQQFNSFLDGDALRVILFFLEFGFLFEPDNFGIISANAYIPKVVQLALPILCAALIALGFVRIRWHFSMVGEGPLNVPRVSLPGIALVAGLTFFAIVGESLYFEQNRPGRLSILVATSVLPLAILAGFWLVSRLGVLQRILLGIQSRLTIPGNDVALMYIMAAVPVAIIAGVSLFIPFFATRHMLLYTPYLLIITSVGVVELFKLSRNRLARTAVVALIAALLVVHFASITYSRDRLVTAVDYKGLAEAWIPEIQPGDTIMVVPHWATTPIFYYLDCERFTCVGRDYENSVQATHPPRVWALSLGAAHTLPPNIEQALIRYRHVRDVEAASIRAEFFTLADPQGAV